MLYQKNTKLNQQVAIQRQDVPKPLLEIANFSTIPPNSEEIRGNFIPKMIIGNNHPHIGYNNSNNIFDKYPKIHHYDLTQKEINNGPDKTYTITPNERRQSPVDESFSDYIFDCEPKDQYLQNELYTKTKSIQALQNKLELMSQLYSDENLRQLEQMNRLIAVILEEKNESTARLETKIREQHDTIHSLSKKLDAKDSVIKTLQGENTLLHKCLNMEKIRSPTKEFSCCVSNETMNSKYIQNNTTKSSDDKGNNNTCQVVSKGEEQYHHPNARRISPVEPWRKVYVQDVIVKGGRTWYWCPKHKMPDYNGLYVTHHPNDHDKWAEKVAENKKGKTMKKEILK